MKKRNLNKENIKQYALTFFNTGGFVPAFKQASRFAGDSGKVATMPDVIEARIASGLEESLAWEKYYTTMSAEYAGVSKSGNPILIIAHENGPMNSLDGVLKAYSHQFNDKSRNTKGGRISREEFLKLESGHYGEVSIVDLNAYLNMYNYPFIEILRESQALKDPVVRARLGGKTEEYIRLHVERARLWHLEKSGVKTSNRFSTEFYEHTERGRHYKMSKPDSDPFLMKIEDQSGCYYQMLENYINTSTEASANLLSIGGLVNMSHQDSATNTHYSSLIFDCSGHGWNDGTRLLASPNGSFKVIKKGVDNISQLLKNNWRQLFAPSGRENSDGFFALMDFDNQLFTQYPKRGEVMDTHEPEFLVLEHEEVCTPKTFRTTIGGYYGFVKYGIQEVKQIAPPGANAYKVVGDFAIEEHNNGNPSHHIATVQFYKVQIHHIQRLLQTSDIQSNYELLMSLIK